MFNADNVNSSSTIIIDYLKSGTQKYRQDAVGKVNLNYYATNPYPLTPYDLLLSRAMADGLARIGSAYRLTEIENPQVIACRKSWCSSRLLDVGAHQIFNTSLYFAFSHFSSQGTNDNGDIPPYNGTGALDPLLKSYAKTANANEIWTKISFPIKRYGYGWGFRSVTFLVAAAVLILEALVVFAHIIRLFCTRWSYQHVDSLAEILDVALKSESLSTAKRDTEEFWARSTSVMGSHDSATSTSSLRLVVGNKRDRSLKGSQVEDLVLGKKYV